jgi:1,2-dihydroxy-3-keto-5-methylthiopentene dioxygenase
MSALTVYPDNLPQFGKQYTDFTAIQNQLNTLGVKFERWTANCELSADADQSSILAAYADSIDSLTHQYGFQSVDVIKLNPDHPEKAAFRQKFLAEHIHGDFEVRFFVEGRGLFYLHVADKVYAVLCTQGDLISVPANTTHWFDMGENPGFTCIRLFTTPDGWVADFTGSDIAKTFPTYDQYVAGLS